MQTQPLADLCNAAWRQKWAALTNGNAHLLSFPSVHCSIAPLIAQLHRSSLCRTLPAVIASLGGAQMEVWVAGDQHFKCWLKSSPPAVGRIKPQLLLRVSWCSDAVILVRYGIGKEINTDGWLFLWKGCSTYFEEGNGVQARTICPRCSSNFFHPVWTPARNLKAKAIEPSTLHKSLPLYDLLIAVTWLVFRCVS